MIKVKRNESGQRIPMNYIGIKSLIKSKLSSEKSRKWLEDDIFEQIQFGNPEKEYYKLSILLANVFALWTLMNS